MNGRGWSECELQLLAKLYPLRPTVEISSALGRSITAVYAMARTLQLSKSEEFLASAASGRLKKGECRPGSEKHRFPKGHVPANKGARRPGWHAGRMRETQFKKGERSGVAAKNWVPIGTISPDSEGYLRIKIREAVFGKEPTGWGNTKVWPLLSRQIWQQTNGPIPAKHIVSFKDGDRQNCSIENLALLSMADNARRNSIWARMPRDLALVIQLNGVLKRKIRSLHGEE